MSHLAWKLPSSKSSQSRRSELPSPGQPDRACDMAGTRKRRIPTTSPSPSIPITRTRGVVMRATACLSLGDRRSPTAAHVDARSLRTGSAEPLEPRPIRASGPLVDGRVSRNVCPHQRGGQLYDVQVLLHQTMPQELQRRSPAIGGEVDLQLLRRPGQTVVGVLRHVGGEVGIEALLAPRAVQRRLHEVTDQQVVEDLPLHGAEQGVPGNLEGDALLQPAPADLDEIVPLADPEVDEIDDALQMADGAEILSDDRDVP